MPRSGPARKAGFVPGRSGFGGAARRGRLPAGWCYCVNSAGPGSGRKTRDLKGMEGDHVSCITAHDPQLARLADAIAQRVGQERFSVWFNNSTRLDLKSDGLEIAVPNDFIGEWIG